MASVSDGRPRLLLHLTSDRDEQRWGVAPALAALCNRAGWVYESYTDAQRAGRHFGGGDPALAVGGASAGSLVLGGGHAELLIELTTHFSVVALGDPDALLWPVLRAGGVEELAASTDPAVLFEAAGSRMDVTLPDTVAVVDAAPQGSGGVVVAPYLAPRILAAEVLAVEVSLGTEGRAALDALGAQRFVGWSVDPDRAQRFPGGLELVEEPPVTSYAETTARLAKEAVDWAEGTLLGDPVLVAAQLPKLNRLRLVPLHGRPQVDVLRDAAETVQRGADPVYGRQWDDRDFFALGALGRGLQVLDPAPPFDASARPRFGARPTVVPSVPDISDAQLHAWADEGRVLTTLLLWSGMVREMECAGRLVDLVASTGLRAGLLVTVDTVEHAPAGLLAALEAPAWRGGVRGQLDLLLSSTGRGVAAEALLPDLGSVLGPAHRRIVELTGQAPDGWWPLLDTTLEAVRPARVGRRGLRPVVFFSPRGEVAHQPPPGAEPSDAPGSRPDLRSLAGRAVRGSPIRHLVEERRPFDDRRPGALSEAVATAVSDVGFRYMWTKACFGGPSVVWRRGDFVALPFTAGNWDGWSPFYTVGSVRDVEVAERRLLASGKPGWLVSNVDGPLWAMAGETWQHGAELHRVASAIAGGGTTSRLINTTPAVIARYARILDDRNTARE